MLEIPQGYFKNHYDLRGSDWLRSVSAEERQAFAHIGRSHAEYGRKGGRARVANARRDHLGRFMRGGR